MDNLLYFNPGCALSLYKPEMEERILAFLNAHYAETLLHKVCCHHNPALPAGSVIINERARPLPGARPPCLLQRIKKAEAYASAFRV